MTDQQYANYQLNRDENNILWLTIDREGTRVNTLGEPVIVELEKIVSDLESGRNLPRGVVIRSGKKGNFIAGADISQFHQLTSEELAYNLMRRVQVLFDRIEKLPMPTVAMINGSCLGGGCELALACDYRIAIDDPQTQIGLPEVKLGIMPGWGGTIRMPRLIGIIKAMPLILTGRILKASQAKKLGIVDAAVAEREMENAARYYVLNTPAKHEPGMFDKLADNPFARKLLASKMKKELASKGITKDHYPAPFTMIDTWLNNGVYSNDCMKAEARAISKLMLTETSRNLVRVFFLQTKMKGLAKQPVQFEPKRVHVIGAGVMGGDIAAWCALRGFRVTLQDRGPEQIAPAIKRAYKLFEKKLRDNRLIMQAMDRLQPDTEGLGARTADVVIEAIFENLDAKQELFKKLEGMVKPDAILATNTSSIPLDEINQVLEKPERLVGIHFFNPVAKMTLVEVVRGHKTSEEIVQKSQIFVGKIGKLPLPVKSKPGFLVNRVLMPYLMEAMVIYEEGVAPELIDQAALKFGMPMGPIRLADQVGLDVCLSVADNLSGHFGGKVPGRLEQMVNEGRLGCKSGEGFYVYENGEAKTEMLSGSIPEEVTDRLILRMVNESVACLREGVMTEKDLLDAGMIFGTGFAPFRGGPLHYAETRGVDEIVSRLKSLASVYGERFNPDKGWSKLQSSKSTIKKNTLAVESVTDETEKETQM